MKSRLLLTVAIVALAACSVVVVGDLEVQWTIDGSDDAALCSTYNIGNWRVRASGPEVVVVTVGCQDLWNTGTSLWSIEEGIYSVTVEAIEAGSADTVLASVSVSNVEVWTDDIDPTVVDIDFTDADFGGGGQDTLNLYWNINGTVDGQPKGLSWDTCDEVGATGVEVEVDGVVTTHDCAANDMTAAQFVDGLPTVKMRLVDSAGALTTWTPTSPGPNEVTTGTYEYVGEFYHDSFLDITVNGDYWFNVSYEGMNCNETSPPVAFGVTLLKLDGTAVNSQVCGPDNTCETTDGASFLPCYDMDQTQKIMDTTWGDYKATFQGTLDSATGYEVCWEKEFDILIGAGTSNPEVAHDLDRISTSGACQ